MSTKKNHLPIVRGPRNLGHEADAHMGQPAAPHDRFIDAQRHDDKANLPGADSTFGGDRLALDLGYLAENDQVGHRDLFNRWKALWKLTVGRPDEEYDQRDRAESTNGMLNVCNQKNTQPNSDRFGFMARVRLHDSGHFVNGTLGPFWG